MSFLKPLQSSKVRLTIVLSAFVVLMLFYAYGRTLWHPMYTRLLGGQSVEEVVEQYGAEARDYWEPLLRDAGVAYPPPSLTLIALKQERVLEVWTMDAQMKAFKLAEFPVLAKSGELGPKRREYDRQIPEGLYRVPGLNPNSAYHLSIELDYPNAWDRAHVNDADKNRMGGDIFIHGGSASIGCIAIGDPGIEKLFMMVAETKKENVEIIIAPFDLRKEYDPAMLPKGEDWYSELYANIDEAMEPYVQ